MTALMLGHDETVHWLAGSWSELQGTQPFWHPLGFVGCFLSSARETAVRVHYWPKGDRRPKQPEWPIHTHVFDVTSTILSGAVTDRRYAIGAGATYAVYDIRYDGMHSRLAPSGKLVDAECVSTHTYGAGSTYRVPRDGFHASYVPYDQEAITVVTVSNLREATSLVLGCPNSNPDPYERATFDRSLFWQKVAAAASAWGE